VNVDSGKQWYDANPHTFHTLALGTLHSLPSPVLRTGQLIHKPEFFGALQREQGAWGALERTSSWLSNVRGLHCLGKSNAQVVQTGLWSRVAITTELGGVLRSMGRHAPHGHGAFSELVFGKDIADAEVINEGDCEGGGDSHEEGEGRQSHTSHEQAAGCGYLEDDDIEDW
jgi:cell cycle checkpoint protein